LDALLERVLDSALEITQAKRGSLLLVDDMTKELRIKAARGLSQEIIDNTRMTIKEGICGMIAKEGEPLLVTNIEEDSRFKRKNNPQYETKSFLGIPLKTILIHSQKNFLGVVYISDKVSGENFTEREETLLSILTGQAAVAIENSQLYNQLRNKIEALKQNVKQLNETQNQLIQTEKMAAVGQLAFGIAHEIRNPLGIILGGVELLGNKLAGKKEEIIKISLEKIEQSIDRANNIITTLLKFSRASQLNLQPVNVCKTMDAVVSLIKNQANLKNVRIKINYKDKDLEVRADPNMLQQAFFNLCINAIDAMPKGGKLFINVYCETKEEVKRNIVIEIADTGKGIPKEKLSKIFEPFFTTKPPGEGTGLGLSIVHLILERHNATIDVESRVREGTKFVIKLPVAKNM
jgi:signal transduction histidine kinase